MSRFIPEEDGGKIKPAGYKQDYSPHQIAELACCEDDINYFIENYVNIIGRKGPGKFIPFEYQKRLLENYTNHQRVICMLPRQTGKLLDLSTPVPTPTGWTTVGDIEVGDTIIGKDGVPTDVTYITPDTWSNVSYEIQFDNGDVVVADEGHLWEVNHSNWNKSKVWETSEVLKFHQHIKNKNDENKSNYGQIYIDVCSAIELPEQKLPINPYLFGYWLGDGHSANGRITIDANDFDNFKNQLDEYHCEGHTFSDKRSTVTLTTNIINLNKSIRELGVKNNKHIPLIYLRSSKEQRISLLQGLMDSDGHSSSRNGAMEITLKSEKLINDVRHLLSSLGVKSTISFKIIKGTKYYRLNFAIYEFDAFRLERKLVNQKKIKGHPKLKRHYIRSIKRTDSRFMRCLSVNNEDHLFLCGNTFIPTHNTTTSTAYLFWKACFTPKINIVIAANIGSMAKEIMEKIKEMYLECPWFIKPGLAVNNVHEIKFDNGTRIIAENTTKSTGRGKSIHVLYLDEFAYVEPNIQKEMWPSVMPTVTAVDGQVIITSTPNTDEDKFARIWFGADDADNSFEWKDELLDDLGIASRALANDKDYETQFENEDAKQNFEIEMSRLGFAEKKDDADEEEVGYKRFFVHWAEHPDRDEKFKRKTLSEGTSLDEWYREFECRFISGDETLIDAGKLLTLNAYAKKPIYVDRHKTYWYEEIEPNTIYGVILDPSEGVGGDNACIQVFSLPDMVQVAEWTANEVDMIEQAKQLVRILKRIDDEQQSHFDHSGESLLYYSIECNGVGMGIINVILYEGEELIPGYLIDSDGNKSRGIRTTNPSKRDYCVNLKAFIERNVLIPRSKGLISEFKTFVKRGKGYEAKPGGKDDRVMACVLMCHMLEELKYHEEEIEDALQFNIIGVEEEEYYDDEDQLPPIL